MKIILIRHAKTRHSQTNYIIDDNKDFNILKSDIKSLHKLKPILDKHEVKHIYSSPHRRSKQTAKILFPNNKITLDKNFREIDKGFNIFLKKHPNMAKMTTQQWEDAYMPKLNPKNRFIKKYPSGKSIYDMYKRVNSSFEHLIKKHNESLAIISNNGPIKCILSKISKNPTKFYFNTYIPYNSIYILSIHKNRITLYKKYII